MSNKYLNNLNKHSMVLYKLKDFDPDYQDAVGRDDIIGLDVYTDQDDKKVGSVKGILVDCA